MDAWVRQNLATPIEVRIKSTQYVAITVLVIMFGAPAAVMFVLGATGAGGGRYSGGPMAGGLIVMLVLVGVCYLLLRSLKKMPKTFDSSGVILKNGRLFRWDEFIGVNYNYIDTRSGPSVFVAWLLFNDGKVSIAPRGIKEPEKTMALIESLPGEHAGKM